MLVMFKFVLTARLQHNTSADHSFIQKIKASADHSLIQQVNTSADHSFIQEINTSADHSFIQQIEVSDSLYFIPMPLVQKRDFRMVKNDFLEWLYGRPKK